MVSLLSQNLDNNSSPQNRKGKSKQKNKNKSNNDKSNNDEKIRLTEDEINIKASKMCADFLQNNTDKTQSLDIQEKSYMELKVFEGCYIYMYNTGLILMVHNMFAYVVLVDEKYIDAYTSLEGFKINGDKFILTVFNKIIITTKNNQKICIVNEQEVKKYITEYFAENIVDSNYSYDDIAQHNIHNCKEIRYVNKQNMFTGIVVQTYKPYNRFEKLNAILYNHEK